MNEIHNANKVFGGLVDNPHGGFGLVDNLIMTYKCNMLTSVCKLIFVLIMMPLMTYGQIIHSGDVDSILIKKAEWGRNMCMGVGYEYFDFFKYPEYIVKKKEQISILIDSLNSLEMIESKYDKRYLHDIECKLYFFKSDRVIMVIPMNRRFLFTQDIRWNADSLSTTIDGICKSIKARESRNSLKLDYLPYEGGIEALYEHLSPKIKKMKQIPNGKYNLWIVCHADKKGKTLDVMVYNELFRNKTIPEKIIKTLKEIVLSIRWIEDKSRLPTDTIVLPISLNIHDNPPG